MNNRNGGAGMSSPGDVGQFGAVRPPTPTDVQPWAAPLPAAQPLSEPQEAAKWSRLRLRHFTASGTGVGASVTTGSTSVAVTFARQEPDTNYGLTLQTDWSTTAYVPAADKATTGFTARFGTACNIDPGHLFWSTFRSEDP